MSARVRKRIHVKVRQRIYCKTRPPFGVKLRPLFSRRNERGHHEVFPVFVFAAINGSSEHRHVYILPVRRTTSTCKMLDGRTIKLLVSMTRRITGQTLVCQVSCCPILVSREPIRCCSNPCLTIRACTLQISSCCMEAGRSRARLPHCSPSRRCIPISPRRR